MTPSSHVAQLEESLATASERMRGLGIHDLPVLQDGKLCGVLSERNVTLAESLPCVAFHRLSVGAAMGGDVYPVLDSAPLAHVVRTMAEHGYLCAVVLEGPAVAGVVTAEDAMRVLARLLEEQPEERDGLEASELRSIIISDHAHLDLLLARARAAVRRLRASHDPERDLRQVRERTRHLLEAVRSHLRLGDRGLAPVLGAVSFGHERLQQLCEGHVRQALETAEMVHLLTKGDLRTTTLATQLEPLMMNLENDLAREHALLLDLGLLRDAGLTGVP